MADGTLTGVRPARPGVPALGRPRLAALAGAVACCLVVSMTPDPEPPLVPPPGATRDLDVFRLVVDRVRAGEAYHDAMHRELLAHGYPTRSVFNWRTPVYAWLLSSPPGEAFWRGALMVMALAPVLCWGRALLEEFGLATAAAGGVALVGSTAWCFAPTYLFGEVWAGVLIALSTCAYRRGRIAAGFAAGIFAVFYRELALPYALVCLGLAVWHGRRREAVAWIVGLALFAAFLGFHAYQVHVRLTDRDVAMAKGWVRFGGARFLLSTARTNVFLMALPAWCTAIYLPMAVLGLLGARGKGEAWSRVALTGGVYLAAFGVAGNPFNFYWGFVHAPILALGFARAPAALRDLLARETRDTIGLPVSIVPTPIPLDGR